MQETAEQYTERMLTLIGEQDPIEVQQQTAGKLAAIVDTFTPEQLTTRPGPNQWSVTEILAHLADTELALGWRIRIILANNGAILQNVDQDVWANVLNYAQQDPKRSVHIFSVLREANLAILRSLPSKTWENYGLHEQRGKETLRHIVRMYAAHDLNHLKQIEQIGSRTS